MPNICLSLERGLDVIVRDPDYFIQGKNLPDEDKKIIESADIWEIALIHDIPSDELVTLGHCFLTPDMEHYQSVQTKWFEKESYLIEKRTGVKPDDIQLIQDAIKNKNMERHRLCYALNYPSKVILDFEGYCENQINLELFLDAAEQLHSYPYYSQIMSNSICAWNEEIPEFSAPFFRAA